MEGSMELHKIDVHENVREDGAYLWHHTGTLVDVGGVEYVRLYHGTLVQRTPDWKESRGEALAAAAERVEVMAGRLMQQVKELREAAHAPA